MNPTLRVLLSSSLAISTYFDPLHRKDSNNSKRRHLQPMASPKGTILLTGANGGLGCGTVSKIISTPELAQYHGVYIVRDSSVAAALKSTLKKAPTSHSYEILSLELSLLANVRDFVRGFSTRAAERDIPPVRALILNAGYNDLRQQSLTHEGFDTSFVANYLGHWLLTMMLLQTMDRENGRIVVLGSNSYDVNHPVHKLNGHYEDEKWKTFFRDENIDTIAKGTWSSNKDDLPRRAGVRRYGVAKIKSSADVLRAAFETSPELRGKYLNGSEPQEVVPEAADIQKRAMVWRDSVKYAQLTEQDTTLVNWT
ncbi:hypothetical protein DL771_000165 [Monosporascus sp. 5C6A]|nr:hypothetical protein DL771_000165 [Monosporascus sp. 5C6A]